MEDSTKGTKKQKAKKIAVVSIIVLLSLALCAAILYIVWPKNEEQGPPPVVTVQAGDTITIRVTAQQVENMYGYQFKLNYDEDVLAFESIHSNLEELGMIFQKPFDGYLLVGATQVGQVPGISSQDVVVCEIVMKTLKEADTASLSITEVNVVDAEAAYAEGVDGWNYKVVKQ